MTLVTDIMFVTVGEIKPLREARILLLEQTHWDVMEKALVLEIPILSSATLVCSKLAVTYLTTTCLLLLSCVTSSSGDLALVCACLSCKACYTGQNTMVLK